MTDEPPRRLIEIGTFPSGFDATFIDGPDPVGVMIADAIRKDDLAKAEAERQRQAAIADAERAKATRRTRALRRLTKAFKAFARLR
jgi:F0F1-type ATP synthase epsilon subunit